MTQSPFLRFFLYDRSVNKTIQSKNRGTRNQLNLKSQLRERVGKKIHKTQQNIFRQHTQRAE